MMLSGHGTALALVLDQHTVEIDDKSVYRKPPNKPQKP
jgi:hypothetical protein